MTYQEAKALKQEKYSKGLNEAGVFYAFSNKQFEENRTHKEVEDMGFYALGAGAYVAKVDIDKWENFISVVSKKIDAEFKANVNREEHIAYELANHEAYYTGDIEETLEVLKDTYKDITAKEVKAVYRNNMHKYD